MRDLGRHPSYILLGIVLGLGAVAVHVVTKAIGPPVSLATLAAAQLGVPVAAATIGSRLHTLHPGEAAALLLGAMTTITVAILGGAAAARTSAPTSAGP